MMSAAADDDDDDVGCYYYCMNYNYQIVIIEILHEVEENYNL
jgi:hypothetical protein